MRKRTSSEAKMGYLQELFMASNTVWKRSMLPERKLDGNFMMDREMQSENNMLSTAQ